MTVERDASRKAVPITWDTSLTDGDTVEVRCVNPNNLEDVSTTEGPNDGLHVVTYPEGYEGETQVTVTGSEGGQDEGTIEA
jgi:hypothetical protein